MKCVLKHSRLNICPAENFWHFSTSLWSPHFSKIHSRKLMLYWSLNVSNNSFSILVVFIFWTHPWSMKSWKRKEAHRPVRSPSATPLNPLKISSHISDQRSCKIYLNLLTIAYFKITKQIIAPIHFISFDELNFLQKPKHSLWSLWSSE